jgi:hypothetical protein
MSAIASLPDFPLSKVFLSYVGVVAAIVAAVLLRYLPTGRALISIGVIAVWLCYAGVIGYSGIVGDPTRMPPGILLLLIPIIAFMAIVLGRSPVGRGLATTIPVAAIFALQTFRVGVELTLSSLHDAGLTTRLLTLAGGNIEILVGLSAPLIALIATRGAVGQRLALVWNIVGLLSLLNVAMRAVLTAPGPLNAIHAELPNVAMGMFPFSFIPGFMAPLAMVLHLLAFRALRAARAASTRPRNQSHAKASTAVLF